MKEGEQVEIEKDKEEMVKEERKEGQEERLKKWIGEMKEELKNGMREIRDEIKGVMMRQ